jgi:intein/homing endonuclease
MLRQVLLPKLNESFAYFLGFLLGDGGVGPNSKPVLYLVGDLDDERDYYDRVLIPLISRLFGITCRPHIKKGQRAYTVMFYSRKVLEHLRTAVGFPGHGVAKFIPEIIRKGSENIRRAFLCGLFDADGSIIFSLKSYGSYCYPTIEIKSVDRAIVDVAREMLVELGFRASVRKSAESWVVAMNGEDQLVMWMKLIGSHNIKHLSKYLLWKERGTCPPYTKVPERLSSLHLNCDNFYSELNQRTGINALEFRDQDFEDAPVRRVIKTG